MRRILVLAILVPLVSLAILGGLSGYKWSLVNEAEQIFFRFEALSPEQGAGKELFQGIKSVAQTANPGLSDDDWQDISKQITSELMASPLIRNGRWHKAFRDSANELSCIELRSLIEIIGHPQDIQSTEAGIFGRRSSGKLAQPYSTQMKQPADDPVFKKFWHGMSDVLKHEPAGPASQRKSFELAVAISRSLNKALEERGYQTVRF